MALSVDNIDFRHGFSRVNVGQQIGCWSGTSVQYIEMNPSLEVINPGTEVESEVITQTQGQCTVNTTTDSYQNREQPIAVGITTHVQVASRKRYKRPSPANSPFKQTRSPQRTHDCLGLRGEHQQNPNTSNCPPKRLPMHHRLCNGTMWM